MDVLFDFGFVNDGDLEIGIGIRGENQWSYCF